VLHDYALYKSTFTLFYFTVLIVYQQCTNRQKQSKTVKYSKTAKMTIGVPIVTYLLRVRRIHKVRVRVRVRRIHKAVRRASIRLA